ncbi:aminotransferase class I/II-fold pyridoxal phosphate-dependent enzyme [Evansella halocellulosilytica]|uniref:aminotransferase class I/II-fold pyridoxal phosphate-dependent enzyme n=1 Tax=Evansella halocellulosilytica TaxID=2011013 RepID=UPI000BB86E6A|nr:aminotransferase class I/II-fold pyridoxal phosphate-dependent enzyme [Evansella halocellulosilytica]
MEKTDKTKIYLSPPHLSGYELKYINEAIESNWIAPVGPHVDQFEKEIAHFAGTKEAVALSSGTAAIHLALLLLNVKKGDYVFCSSLTFVASANPILYQGAQPVFIDSERDSWNMSPQALEKALKDARTTGSLPKAVIVVNLYGQVAKMEEIVAICNQYSVPMIEDAAESLGSTYKGQHGGTFGCFGIYSFNGNKIITTSGGGMLVSNNVKAMKRARFLATQAKDRASHYEHSEVGFNYRMSNLLASVGRAQLQVIEERVQAKRAVFNRYYQELADIPGIQFMPELRGTRSNRWLTVLTIDERSGFTNEVLLGSLEAENIEARPVWKPLHMQPLFKGAAFYPHSELEHVCEKLFYKGICLPSGTNMTEQEQNRVIECIKSHVKVTTP